MLNETGSIVIVLTSPLYELLTRTQFERQSDGPLETTVHLLGSVRSIAYCVSSVKQMGLVGSGFTIFGRSGCIIMGHLLLSTLSYSGLFLLTGRLCLGFKNECFVLTLLTNNTIRNLRPHLQMCPDLLTMLTFYLSRKSQVHNWYSLLLFVVDLSPPLLLL